MYAEFSEEYCFECIVIDESAQLDRAPMGVEEGEGGADGGVAGGVVGGVDGGADGGAEGGVDGGTDGGAEGGVDGGAEGGGEGEGGGDNSGTVNEKVASYPVSRGYSVPMISTKPSCQPSMPSP